MKIKVFWQADERDLGGRGRLLYRPLSTPPDALSRLHEVKAEKLVRPLLLDIDEAKDAMVQYHLYFEANGGEAEGSVLPYYSIL
jgi:hypothetical protein